MSKILRRPMFRGGGKVSSYGNGISTGLADSYEKGGSVQPRQNFIYGGLATSLFNAARVAGPSAMRYGRQGLNSVKNLFRNPPKITRGSSRVPEATGSYSPINITPSTNTKLGKFFADDPILGSGAVGSAFKGIGGTAKYLTTKPSGIGLSIVGAPYLKDMYNKMFPGDPPVELAGAPDAVTGDGLETEEEKNFRTDQRRLQALLEEQRLSTGNVSEEDKFAKLKKNKEMFKKILSDGKSTKIQDASEMALSFAGNALEEGATTKSALAKFFKDEAKRPSKGSKINDAASAAVLNAYIAGEKTKGEVDAYFAKLKVQTEMGRRAGDIAFHLLEAGKVAKGFKQMDLAVRNAYKGKVPNKVKTGEDFKITNDMIGEIFIEDEAPYSVFTITEDLIKETLY